MKLLLLFLCFVLLAITSAKTTLDELMNEDIERQMGIETYYPSKVATNEIKLSSTSGMDPATAMAAIACVKAGIGAFDELTTALSTKKAETVEIFTRQGFEHFAQKSVVRVIKGFDNNKLGDLVDLIMKKSRMPPGEGLEDEILTFEFADETTWNGNQFFYTTEETGSFNYLFVMKNQHATDADKSNWMTVSYEGTFMAAPDILFTEKSASYVGGIFQSYKQEIKSTPHYMTAKEIHQLQEFCLVMALGSLARSMDIPVEFPEIPEDNGQPYKQPPAYDFPKDDDPFGDKNKDDTPADEGNDGGIGGGSDDE